VHAGGAGWLVAQVPTAKAVFQRRGAPYITDVSRLADGTRAATVLQAARQANGTGLLQDVVLFDTYRPPAGHAEHGHTSMALRLVLGSPTATLTDEQADAAVAEVQQALVQHCQARLRI
ncbi:MAG: phenylalanine--tRNA ligase subunit beta, partial [Burkholderiaceae bacterium]